MKMEFCKCIHEYVYSYSDAKRKVDSSYGGSFENISFEQVSRFSCSSREARIAMAGIEGFSESFRKASRSER